MEPEPDREESGPLYDQYDLGQQNPNKAKDPSLLKEAFSMSMPLSREEIPGDEHKKWAAIINNGSSRTPPLPTARSRPEKHQDETNKTFCNMHKYTLYETSTRFYLVGADVMDFKHRLLKIDRTVPTGELGLSEDEIVYTKSEMNELLNAIDDGNKGSGGLQLRSNMWGLLGFIRFTGDYYMLLITKRSQVAMLGGHYIYQVDGTELVSLAMHRSKVDRHPEEARFVSILKELDLSRSFYFSYSYDVTNTLQQNMMHDRQHLGVENPAFTPRMHYNKMFIWNHYLLGSPASLLKTPYEWCLPIIHGFVDQASMYSIRQVLRCS
jgi:hypothetical protein